MPDTYLTIQTLGFATGTVLFGLLAVLSRRAQRLSGQSEQAEQADQAGLGLHSAWLGMLWNVGMLVEYIGRLAGVRLSSLPMRLVAAAAFTALTLLPTVFLLAALRRYETRQPLGGKRRLLFFSYLLSCLIAAGLTLNLFAGSLGLKTLLPWPYALNAIAYNLVAHLVVIFLLFRRTREFPARAFVRLELWLLVVLALTLMLSIHSDFNLPIERTIRVISQQSGIPIALTAIASLSRFRFADVFIKRSFTILAAVVTVLLYSLFVIRPLLRLVRAAARYPDAAGWVLMTVLGCALLLVFPTLQRWIHQATDRWLFRRPDYRQLARVFAAEIERAESEEQLPALVKRQLQTALQIENVHLRPHSDAPPPESGLLTPVKVNGNVEYLLAVEPGRAGRKLLSDEIAFLSTLADLAGRKLENLRFEHERRRRELREAHLQTSLTQAELRALQAQINPHFLFNTLNTIADLIAVEPEKAELMTERLAEVFRYVLAQSEARLISVREEFDFLQTYLAIEQVRFGERLQVEMTMEPAAATALIPSLLLQPLVENAVKHGLSPKREGGRLRIQAARENDCLRLTVEDDGIGWNDSRAANRTGGAGVGLKNVRERLQAVYEGRAELRIESVPGKGTQIHIIIPTHEAENTAHRRRSIGAFAVGETAGRAS